MVVEDDEVMPPEIDFKFCNSLFDNGNIIDLSENTKREYKDRVFWIDRSYAVVTTFVSKDDVIAKIVSHFWPFAKILYESSGTLKISIMRALKNGSVVLLLGKIV